MNRPARCFAVGHRRRTLNHSFRATRITACPNNGGSLGKAAQMVNHASGGTTQFYGRRREELSLNKVEGNTVWTSIATLARQCPTALPDPT